MSSRLRVRYWVGVMAKEQVSDAIKKGYCEFKNGTKLPFKHVNPHSWFVYYSPGTKSGKVIREKGEDIGCKVQAFTAIGQVLPGEPYSMDLGNDTIVYRRNARYVPHTTEAPLLPTLINELSFLSHSVTNRSWGVPFRRGLIEVLKSDFYRLCEAMNIEMPKRHHMVFDVADATIVKKKPPVDIIKDLSQQPIVIDDPSNSNKENNTAEDLPSLSLDSIRGNLKQEDVVHGGAKAEMAVQLEDVDIIRKNINHEFSEHLPDDAKKLVGSIQHDNNNGEIMKEKVPQQQHRQIVFDLEENNDEDMNKENMRKKEGSWIDPIKNASDDVEVKKIGQQQPIEIDDTAEAVSEKNIGIAKADEEKREQIYDALKGNQH